MKPAKFDSATMDEQTFIPNTMRALYQTATPPTKTEGAPDGPISESGLIFDTDFPTPRASPTQYLIKVITAAFSHDELRLAHDLNPSQSMPQIPLHNFCGTVIATPSKDHWSPNGPRFKIGDCVFGLASYDRDGAAADYTLATESELAYKPQNLSAAEAATIPIPALTAWQALFTYAGLDPASANTNNDTTNLRVLVTNARDNEAALQMLRLLRSWQLFPNANARPWICATCSSDGCEEFLRKEVNVDEVVLAPLPIEQNFHLPTVFHDNSWDPVDIVFDCAGGETYLQSHSPFVVKDHGVVLTAVDSRVARTHGASATAAGAIADECNRGLFSRFVAVRPDGRALRRISELCEAHQVKGRVQTIVDLVNAASLLGEHAAASAGGRRGGMMVVRVNPS